MVSDTWRTRTLRRVVGGSLLAPAGWVLGCQTGITVPATGDAADGIVSFSTQVQPIFAAHCAGCHSPGGAADLAGIELKLTQDVAYDLLVNQPSVQRGDLTLVVPGDSAASLLFAKVSSSAPPVGERMPRFAPALAQADIDLIRTWIDEGAPDN